MTALTEASDAINAGNVEALRGLLRDHAELATATVGPRSLLHLVNDWPGCRLHTVEMIAALVEAGADVNARFVGAHRETPLHWAASNDDLAALDALLDAGADIEADGAVIAGGTPLSDAVAFGQWKAARRLVERGATATVREAAALGLVDQVRDAAPAGADATEAFWYACHGGQQEAAEYLLERGAELNWVARWDGLTPLDAAVRSQATELVEWLRGRGGQSAATAVEA